MNIKFIEKIPIPRLKFPTELEFEPIQLCNAKCFTCPYTFLEKEPDYKNVRMSRENIEVLLSDFGNLLKKNKYYGTAFVNPFRFSDPLICPDLDLVFEQAKKFNFKIRITTNGVSFNEKTGYLLNKYINHIHENVSISVIGSTVKKVKKNMSVNLDLTLIRLKDISKKYPELTKKITIGLAEVEKSQEENFEFAELSKKFNSMGIKTYIKKNWIYNRINGEIKDQDEQNFIKGCGLFKNKPLRRIEVKVDGSVVLCDDDADGRKVFGNVFKEGIEKIWQGPLLKEHLLIYQKDYSENKKNLICKTCSRAQWNSRKGNAFNSLKELKSSFVLKESLKKNVSWI